MRFLRAIVTPLISVFAAASASAAEPLVVGGAAPAFTLQGSDGSTHQLSDYLGKRELVLAWFPKAFTPG